eukprot:3013192-Ditylum_brightwellii.AAC.1
MNKFIHEILCARTKSSAISNAHTRSSCHNDALESFLRNVVASNKVIYFGEYHGEDRIIALQTELVKSMSSLLSSSSTSEHVEKKETGSCPPLHHHGGNSSFSPHRPRRVHVIMEHFSTEMQPLLHKYQTQPSYTYDTLKQQYEDIGTEGHNLDPYKHLLEFCRSTTLLTDDDNDNDGQKKERKQQSCEVKLHGGFIPRPLAAQWNKCNEDK